MQKMINFTLRQTSKVRQTMLQTSKFGQINPSLEAQYSMENMSLQRKKTQEKYKMFVPPHEAKFNAVLPMQCNAKEQVVLHTVNRLEVFMDFVRPEENKLNGKRLTSGYSIRDFHSNSSTFQKNVPSLLKDFKPLLSFSRR